MSADPSEILHVDNGVTYLIGDTRERVRELPDASVSLVTCSPPFIALRSYLPDDHPDKHAEIGSEPDPATFLNTLLQLTAEWGRALAPWGSLAIELGDTYAGELGGDWPRAKSLALVPQLYAASLAYGKNLMTGAPSPAGRWLVRNMVVWHRPNPAVGALGDKFRPATSYITIATRSPRRWFDLTAVRTASAPPLDAWFDQHDTWTIPTQPSALAHYAMWPPSLAERLVVSMCPRWVCSVCGDPRRRIEGRSTTPYVRSYHQGQHGGTSTGGVGRHTATFNAPTIGWTDCGHGSFTPGVVLDPFAGTGTTLAVAALHGRHAIGIDIDARNRDLYSARRAECSRALFGTKAEVPGQADLFSGVA